MKEYESIFQEIGPLPNTTVGLCQELMVINCTDDPIGVIDKQGNKIIVQPESGRKNGTIKVYVKKGVGNVTSDTHKIKSNPGHICNINYRSIITEPVYVKEADILVCYYKNIDLYSHPNISMSYQESVERLFEELSKVDSIKVPTLKIMANSIDKNIKSLFVYIFGVICEIEITYYNTSDHGVTFIFPKDSTQNLFIPFDDILNNNGFLKTKYFNCFIGTSKEIIKQSLEKELNNTLKYTEDEIIKIKEELKKDMESSSKEMKNNLKEKYENEILSKINRISQLENELAAAKMEIDTLRKLISSADSFLNYTQKSMNHQTESLKQETERMKILFSFIKIAIPIFIAWGVGKYT